MSPREIRVDHANWAPEGSAGRGRVALDQPVRDVSAAGDWSQVRVFYPRLGELGATVFQTQGFILPGPVVAGPVVAGPVVAGPVVAVPIVANRGRGW